MNMTNEEIVRGYSQAANKAKQIKILADLNACSPGEIRAVLVQAGIEGGKAIRQRKQEPAPKSQASAPAEDIYERIETILAALPEDSSDYVKAMARNLVSALFRESIEKRLGAEVQHDA